MSDTAAADALDAAIDEALGGRVPTGVDEPLGAVVTRLAAVATEPAPPTLAATVARRLQRERRERRWVPARVAAAALGLAFASHSFGGFFLGEWVAEQVGGHYDVHTSTENGVAFLALAALLFLGVFRPRWLEAAVAVAAPVGVFLGINGAPELGYAPNAGALHLIEGLAGVALLGLWLWARRYGPPADNEGET